MHLVSHDSAFAACPSNSEARSTWRGRDYITVEWMDQWLLVRTSMANKRKWSREESRRAPLIITLYTAARYYARQYATRTVTITSATSHKSANKWYVNRHRESRYRVINEVLAALAFNDAISGVAIVASKVLLHTRVHSCKNNIKSVRLKCDRVIGYVIIWIVR